MSEVFTSDADPILVSCVIATFNRAQIVRQAIESTLAQSYANWELILVDDQSTDDTWEVISEYAAADQRIKCFRNPNKGANYARNLGIGQASGKYIAFLDDDDVSLPHRFASQLRAMQSSGSRFIVSWHEVRDRQSGALKRTDKTVLRGSGAGFPSRWMIEKTLLEEVGGFNPKMRAMQEIELSYRLAAKYTYAHHADVVTTMYHSEESTSKGENGALGKIQLLGEVGHLMFPEEKAFWAYSVALWYLRNNQQRKALHYYQQASASCSGYRRLKPIFLVIAGLCAISKTGFYGSKLAARLIPEQNPLMVEHRLIYNN